MRVLNAQQCMNLLGYAGLIPFVVAAIVAVSMTEYRAAAVTVANVYAFGIISFLTGSWWGMAIKSGSRRLLLLSNLYFLVAFFTFLFATAWWPLAAAILLMAMFFAEQNLTELPAPYRRLRIGLTSVAALSMLTLHLSA